TLEKAALELHDLATSQTRHVQMIALCAALVEMAVPPQVEQVQFVHEPVALQQRQSAINSYPVDAGIQFFCSPQDLASVQMLFCSLNDGENHSPLPGHSDASRRKLSLQMTRRLALRHGHLIHLLKASCNITRYPVYLRR